MKMRKKMFIFAVIIFGFLWTFAIYPNAQAAASISLNGSAFEFDTANIKETSIAQIDSTYYLVTYSNISSSGVAVILEVDTGTGSVTKKGSKLTFDSTLGQFNSLAKIDSTHFLNTYRGTNGNGWAVMLEVDTGAGTITQKGSKFEFETSDNSDNSLVQIDSTHFLNTYKGDSFDGFVVMLEVNTGTGSITKKGSTLEFDTTEGQYNSLAKIDSTHFLNTYRGPSALGNAIMFEVNTGTGSIIQKGSNLIFDTGATTSHSLVQIDSTHLLNTFNSNSAGKAAILEVNTGTGAITQTGSTFEFDATADFSNSLVSIDGTNFLNTYRGVNSDGFAVVLNVDVGSGTITQDGSTFEFDTIQGDYNSLISIDGTYFLNAYSGVSGDGYGVMLEVTGLPDPPPGATQTDTIDITWAIGETISLSCSAGAVSVGAITGDGQGTIDSDTCNVRTNDTDGYTLAIKGTTKSTLDDGDTPNHTVAAYTEGTPGTPEAWSIATTESAWGVHLGSGSTTTTPLTWGADSYAGNWIGVLTSDKTIASRSDETLHAGDDEIIYFGAEVGTSKIQPSGSYTGQVTLTATTNP